MQIENKKILHTDILIIGGGTAGCYAALTIREQSDYSIVIAEKANIKRSGCVQRKRSIRLEHLIIMFHRNCSLRLSQNLWKS